MTPRRSARAFEKTPREIKQSNAGGRAIGNIAPTLAIFRPTFPPRFRPSDSRKPFISRGPGRAHPRKKGSKLGPKMGVPSRPAKTGPRPIFGGGYPGCRSGPSGFSPPVIRLLCPDGRRSPRPGGPRAWRIKSMNSHIILILFRAAAWRGPGGTKANASRGRARETRDLTYAGLSSDVIETGRRAVPSARGPPGPPGGSHDTIGRRDRVGSPGRDESGLKPDGAPGGIPISGVPRRPLGHR
jgi:hypothetical protein